jgi:hypothetical protein
MTRYLWIFPALAVGFVAGRFFTPPKTVIKTVTKTEKVIENKNIETKTHIVKKPSGEVITQIVRKDLTQIDRSNYSQTLDTQKPAKSQNQWAIGAHVLVNWGFGKEYGGFVSHRFIGPISLGVIGTQRGAGVMVSMDF